MNSTCLVIKQPTLKEENGYILISSVFCYENIKKSLWYKIPAKYKDYLVPDNCDAFLVGLLFLAMKKKMDILVEGEISSKLLYGLNHYVQDALAFAHDDLEKVLISAKKLVVKDHNIKNIAGTAMSCGVDSLTTYYEHKDETKEFEIGAFTFFNVGSHGDYGGSKAREVFNNRLKRVREFGDSVGVEVISVDSNLSEILEMRFIQTYNLRNGSCILLLQKAFKNFYYSSGTKFNHFSMNKEEIADLDMLVMPNLSTESTNIYVSALRFSRIERTNFISQFSETYKYLDVCTHAHHKGSTVNCSECYKCNRTMATLELLGKLELYEHVFDIQKFRRNRTRYIGHVLSKKKLTLDKEFLKFLYGNKKRLPIEAYWYAVRFYFYRKKKRILKYLN